MTLQLLHSEFPYIWGNFDFLFYQGKYTYLLSYNNRHDRSEKKHNQNNLTRWRKIFKA